MMDRFNPAQITDLMVRPLSSIVIDCSDYYVIKCPERPDFVFGNYIALKKPPEKTDEVAWWKRLRTEFSDCPSVRKTTVQWESFASPSETASQEQASWAELERQESYTRDVVLNLQNHASVTSARSISGRKLCTATDWEEMKHFACSEFANDEVTDSFLSWRIDKWREIVEQGAGMWWALWCGKTMIANAGIFWSEAQSIARLQSVVVQADLRGRGIGRQLVTELLNCMNRVTQIARVIAVAENGAPSARLYTRVGFVEIGWQYTAVRSNCEVDSW
jgi:GNAT superfamily N-acetyltransferase